MKISEICQYLNEIGILSLKNTNLFLSLYSGFIKNNNQINFTRKKALNANLDNNIFITILFAFLKKVISNDKDLYELCTNVISLHPKNKLIKQYQGICFLKKIIFYQIKNRFNHFLFLLFVKKYPKRKYFPYNPLYAAKSYTRFNDIKNNNISYTTTNQRRKNNILDEYSLSYISNNNKYYNKINNNLIINTGDDGGIKSENRIGHHSKNKSPKFIDIVDKMNNKKKEISVNNMKKKLYDAQIRINNYENIIPISRRNRKKEQKNKEEENFFIKEKEDKLYQKLTEKELDKNNILDRLYRKEIIKKQDIKRKEKEQEKKSRTKSPINWDRVNSINSKKKYLNININSQDINSIKDIINKPKGNLNSYNHADYNNFNINQNNNRNKIQYNNLNNNIKKGNYGIYNQENDIENEEDINDAIENLDNLNKEHLEELNKKANIINSNTKKINDIKSHEYNIGQKIDDYNSKNINNNLLGNNEEKELINKQNYNDNEEDENINENKYNLPRQYVSKNKELNKSPEFIKNNNNIIDENNQENQTNDIKEEEINAENYEEEIIQDNEMASPDEQMEENENMYGEEDEENEEIEYDINNINNNNNININSNINSNEFEKIGDENINYEEMIGENNEDSLNDEDK